jgi:pSer/pThr/pTyr-binding forkhead associated (FHA) protein
MAELIIQSGKHQGRRLRFADAVVTIGREDDCQIRLTSAEVSKQHCRLRQTELGLVVQDLGSSNGTFVNDVRIETETRLNAGDRLRVGPMVFEVPAASKAPAGGTSGRRKKSDPLSEDDIASWLADETDHGEASAADTTIIETTAAPAASAPGSASTVVALTSPASPGGVAVREDRKKFRTVADEAADIIRRWWQMQREEQS